MGTDDSRGLYFKIGEVAKQIDVVPATIRNWEKYGLITIRRSSNGYRVFSLDDIEYLKKIKQKSKDENIGIGGIRQLVGPSNRISSPADSTRLSKESSPRFLGSKWKECRLQRNYSLEDAASRVGISVSYLSKIENGQANVSYKILQKLASLYGENILYFLKDPNDESPIVRSGTSESFGIGIQGLEIFSLIERKNHTISALLYSVEPGCERDDDSSHRGEEFVYVLTGKVEFTLNGNTHYLLSSGDSISFSSNTPHRWRNHSGQTTKLLWIYTPLETL